MTLQDINMGLNIVMTGYDHTVFENLGSSNTKERLIGYAAILEGHHPKSKLTYLALRAPKEAKKFTKDNVDFIPIYCNILSLFYKLPYELSKLNNISFVFSQTPYEDGFICLAYSKIKRILYGVQVHNDLQNTPGIPPIALIRQFMSYCCFLGAKIIRTVNPITGSQLRKSYGDKVKTIPVTPSIIPCLRTGTPDKPHILIVSRLSKEKGVDIGLEVIAKVSGKLPNVKVTIIGDGNEENKLKHQAKLLGIDANFLGAISPQDLSDYYCQATLLLLTSKQEGWGRVLIEAIFAGLPIVATETLGAKAIVKNNENGFLHPIDDVEALSSSVIKLCFDKDLNNKMGYESYKISKIYQSQKLDHELIESILSKLTTKDLK